MEMILNLTTAPINNLNYDYYEPTRGFKIKSENGSGNANTEIPLSHSTLSELTFNFARIILSSSSKHFSYRKFVKTPDFLTK